MWVQRAYGSSGEQNSRQESRHDGLPRQSKPAPRSGHPGGNQARIPHTLQAQTPRLGPQEHERPDIHCYGPGAYKVVVKGDWKER